MNDILKELKSENYKIVVTQDTDADNPRTFDCNVCEIIAYTKSRNFTDPMHKAYYLNRENVNNWDELENKIRTDFPDIVYMRALFLYEHSGLSFSFSKSCAWDSGQIGFIFIRQTRLNELGIKEFTTDDMNKNAMEELKQFEQWNNGNVYFMALYKKESCECCKRFDYTEIDFISGEYDNSDAHLIDFAKENGINTDIEIFK